MMADIWKIEYIAESESGEELDYFDRKDEAIAWARDDAEAVNVVRVTHYLDDSETVWTKDNEECSDGD